MHSSTLGSFQLNSKVEILIPILKLTKDYFPRTNLLQSKEIFFHQLTLDMGF